PPTTAPPTAPTPDACPAFSTSRTSSITAHSRQTSATTGDEGGGATNARGACRGGSDLATGFGCTFCSAGFGCSGWAGCSGIGATAVPELWPVEVGIQPITAPTPTRLNRLTAPAARMTSG